MLCTKINSSCAGPFAAYSTQPISPHLISLSPPSTGPVAASSFLIGPTLVSLMKLDSVAYHYIPIITGMEGGVIAINSRSAWAT